MTYWHGCESVEQYIATRGFKLNRRPIPKLREPVKAPRRTNPALAHRIEGTEDARRFAGGDRVQLSAHGFKRLGSRHRQFVATVVGRSMDFSCVRIIVEGNRTPSSYHHSFLERID